MKIFNTLLILFCILLAVTHLEAQSSTPSSSPSASSSTSSQSPSIKWEVYHFPELQTQAQTQTQAQGMQQPQQKQKGLQQEQKKPYFLYFYADWCHYCQYMKHFYLQNSEVIQWSRQFFMARFDVDDKDPKVKALFKKYRVHGFPIVVFLSPEGEWLQNLTLIGLPSSKEMLIEQMKKVLATPPPSSRLRPSPLSSQYARFP